MSGSVTGSIASYVYLNPQVFTSSLGCIFVAAGNTNPNSFYVYTFSNMLTQTLSDSAIGSGSYDINIGITY